MSRCFPTAANLVTSVIAVSDVIANGVAADAGAEIGADEALAL